MTFCVKLAEKTQGDYRISAWEETEKFETIPTYSIMIEKNDTVYEVIKCARTTWKRRFNAIEL